MKLVTCVCAVFLFATAVAAQWRPNTIQRPCPNTSTTAKVQVESDGDIGITPCTGRTTTIGSNVSLGTALSGVSLASPLSSIGDVNSQANATMLRINDSTQSFIFNNDGSAAATVDFQEVSTFNIQRTITPSGTTGNRTINKTAGTVNFAAAATAITVTNSLVNTSSLIFTTIRTADATCTFVKSTVPAAGSFVITLNAGCTAETSVGFLVLN